MPKHIETPLAPKDIGIITPEIKREHSAAVKLLARQNVLVDGWLEANTAIEQLGEIADPELIRALEDRLLSLNEQLRATFGATNAEAASPEETAALKQAERDLGLLAVLQMEKEKSTGAADISQPLFFSSADRERAAQVRATEETSHWLPKKLRLKMNIGELVGKSGAHKDFKDKLKEQARLREHHKTRAGLRKAIADKVTESLGAEQLTKLEERLKEIQTITRIIETGADTLKQDEATDLQIIKAKQCLSIAQEYLTEPTPGQSFEPVAKSYAELRRILDIKRLTTVATKRVERMALGLEEQIAKARAKGRGIIHLFETLPKVGRLDVAELERIYGEVQAAGKKVEAAYTDVSATTKLVLEKLQSGSSNPAQVEGLVMTIENGNLNELYLGSFNAAMKEFNAGLEALGQLLNLRPAAELAAKPEPKGLLKGKEKETTVEFAAFENKALEYIEKLLKAGAPNGWVAEGLAGLDSDRAWKMRERLEKEGADKGLVALGLAGLDSDRAWEMRERLEKEGANKGLVAEGLAGLDSDRAYEMRERLLKAGANKGLVAVGLAGNSATFVWQLDIKR